MPHRRSAAQTFPFDPMDAPLNQRGDRSPSRRDRQDLGAPSFELVEVQLATQLRRANLDIFCAPVTTGPIRCGNPHPFSVEVPALSRSVRNEMAHPTRGHVWCTEHPGYGLPYATCARDGSWSSASQDRIWELSRALLEFGGEEAVLPAFEPELDRIVDRGQLWSGQAGRVQMVVGHKHQAHRNCARYWAKRPDRAFLATGFALDTMGLWRRHAWILEPDVVFPRPRPAIVVETTESHKLYFGFVLDLDESLSFCLNHADLLVDVASTTKTHFGFEPDDDAEPSDDWPVVSRDP